MAILFLIWKLDYTGSNNKTTAKNIPF